MGDIRQLTKIVRNMRIVRAPDRDKISDSEYEVLRKIIKHPGITGKDIAEALEYDKALVTRRSQQLVKEGLITVREDERDKRQRRFFATDEAIALRLGTKESERNFYDECLAVLNEDEKDVYLNLTEKIYKKSKELRLEHHKKTFR